MSNKKKYFPQNYYELKELIDNNIPASEIDVSKVTKFTHAGGGIFNSIKKFNDPGVSDWDVGEAKNMCCMFRNAKYFNQDISKWNVGNVEDMNYMFKNAASFNQDISKWDVRKVEYMCCMFARATSFNQDISKWNTGKVRSMHEMFKNATSFNQDISKWNVGNVKSMRGMFEGATSFNQDISNWDVGSVLNINAMFKNSAINYKLDAWASKIGNIDRASNFYNRYNIDTEKDLNGWKNLNNFITNKKEDKNLEIDDANISHAIRKGISQDQLIALAKSGHEKEFTKLVQDAICEE